MYETITRQNIRTGEFETTIRPASFSPRAIIGFRLFAVSFSIIFQRMITSHYKLEDIRFFLKVILAITSYAAVATVCQALYIISMYAIAIIADLIGRPDLFVNRHNLVVTRGTQPPTR